MIAEHNYKCFTENTTADIDVPYLTKLGPSAIPTLCKIVKNDKITEANRKTALYALGEFSSMQEDTDVQKMNLPMIRARNAFNELDAGTKEEAKAEYKASAN